MTSSKATGRSQSSRGHQGVVGDGATRLVEPDPRLPGKLRCGQRRGERRFGRPIARAKARLANRARTPGRYDGVGDLPPERPRTTATASRRPVIYTPGGPLHECAGGVMHAGRLRSASPFAEPPTRTLQAAGRTRSGGVPYTRPVKILSGFRYGTLVSAHSSPAQNPRSGVGHPARRGHGAGRRDAGAHNRKLARRTGPLQRISAPLTRGISRTSVPAGAGNATSG
jgi:hypothetical protein